jgi:hypothetical protein
MPLARERVILPELLDHANLQDARENLKDLVRINRYFGGYRLVRGMLAEFQRPGDRFSLLDVGAASGDMGASIRESFSRANIVSLDRIGRHLALAPHPKLVADAFQMPFPQGSFDFVFASLFLHHFSNDQVVELLRSFKRVAGRAVIVLDLERGPLAYRFLPATRWLFGWHPITVYDGPVSVQAAFKKDELLALATRAGLSRARVSSHRPWARLSLVAQVSA